MEFLASRDNWFRPSMVRTGPDGALWVADMYRLVIEHPEWIPKDWQAKIDLRAGSDKGRLYRVYPAQLKPWPVTKLVDLGPKELVAKLETTNGTVRDLVLQQIVERFAGQKTRTPEVGQVADELNRLFRESSRPTTRLGTLCALSLLGELDTLVLRAALEDEHPGVRHRALQLVDDEFLSLDKHLLTAVRKTVDDADSQVRLQAVCTLGDINDPAAMIALAEGIRHDLDRQTHLRAGASSLNAENIDAVTGALAAAALKEGASSLPVVQCLGDTAVALDARLALAQLCRLVVETKSVGDRNQALIAWLDILARHSSSLEKLRAKPHDDLRQYAAAVDTLLDDARRTVADVKAAEQVLRRGNSVAGANSQPASGRAAVARGFAQAANLGRSAISGDRCRCTVHRCRRGRLIARALDDLAPARKRECSTSASRKDWIERLLAALEAKQVAAAEIDATCGAAIAGPFEQDRS
ncbi:MAG: HEAT repeat domain-containing protein [Pirellulales bacterium]